MTADEIRREQFDHDDGAWQSARWLKELAAQLAETNALLRDAMRALRGTLGETSR